MVAGRLVHFRRAAGGGDAGDEVRPRLRGRARRDGTLTRGRTGRNLRSLAGPDGELRPTRSAGSTGGGFSHHQSSHPRILSQDRPQPSPPARQPVPCEFRRGAELLFEQGLRRQIGQVGRHADAAGPESQGGSFDRLRPSCYGNARRELVSPRRPFASRSACLTHSSGKKSRSHDRLRARPP